MKSRDATPADVAATLPNSAELFGERAQRRTPLHRIHSTVARHSPFFMEIESSDGRSHVNDVTNLGLPHLSVCREHTRVSSLTARSYAEDT
jgi:hypothetical protein